MWMIAFWLSMVLASATAAAFDCVGVTFPPTVVLCSDPELTRLADERQAAINEARARIGEQAWPALWEDQKRWVRSYATACGVPPDRPPPSLVPPSIKECFRQAGEARIAYLRAYGVPAGGASTPAAPDAAPSGRVGPSFDCSKAASPLPLMICGDPGLSQLDFRFSQAYWALFQRLGPGGQAQLKAEDIQFIGQVQQQCGLPTSGPLTPAAWQSRDCIKDAYERQRQAWVARLVGPAYEEAVRQPERHLTLQKDLQDLGFIPAGPIDGVYGPATRTGVAAWQSRHGLAVTGLVGDAEARLIEQEVIANPVPDRGQSNLLGSGTGEISMKNAGGVYVVGVRINGAIMLDFIVDSGASDVVIPADVAMTLARAGTISSGDFIGDREYRLGDGSTLKSKRFILRELMIGDRAVQNIVASIGSMKGEPLLGQSFLSRFASWSVDNNRHALVLGELRH
jgi:clan AA aspartic protease (TIGR02281 family)